MDFTFRTSTTIDYKNFPELGFFKRMFENSKKEFFDCFLSLLGFLAGGLCGLKYIYYKYVINILMHKS